QQGSQDGDDRDHYQQLDQSERMSSIARGHRQFPAWRVLVSSPFGFAQSKNRAAVRMVKFAVQLAQR
ncbi:MAG TPA: hypothetical protein VFG04_09210, partial [Planctomycetaceae bacterium]|nr:hypothetical protein [Planctomycetaceae bacterium]